MCFGNAQHPWQVGGGKGGGRKEGEMKMYVVRMNIAVSRAFGELRLVVPRREVEKDNILGWLISASNF
jgi:hypothetical protein